MSIKETDIFVITSLKAFRKWKSSQVSLVNILSTGNFAVRYGDANQAYRKAGKKIQQQQSIIQTKITTCLPIN